jgi:hypothetical protein
MVGAKRYIAPMPKLESEPRIEKTEKNRQVPPQKVRDTQPPPSAPRVSTPSGSQKSSKKAGDQFALNDGNSRPISYLTMYLPYHLTHTQTHLFIPMFLLSDQKAFLKRAKETNMQMRYEQNNPKNGGSASYDRYETYKAGRTVAEALKLGAKSADIPYDYSRGYITFPDGGEFASFRLMGDDDDTPPPKPQRPQKSESVSSSNQVIPEKSMKSASPSPSGLSSKSAFGITAEDVQYVKVDREVIDYDAPGSDKLKLAESAYKSKEFDECWDYLQQAESETQDEMIRSEVLRIRALVNFHVMAPSKSSMLSKSAMVDDESRPSGRKIHFSEYLPTLNDGSTPYRDLAKETRQENNLRHEPKGVTTMFDARLKEMLDELFACVNDPQANSSDELLEVVCDFRDATETFKLHSKSPMPMCDKPPEGAVRLRGCDVEGMVEMISTANTQWGGVDKYGKFGLTPLSIAARLGKYDLVETLLELGADTLNAVDGATYLSEKKSDLAWIVDLLKSFRSFPDRIPQDTFLKLVRHARKKGDTPLLVAVNNNDVAAAKQLLEWGALVESPDQRRSSDQASCYDVAKEKNIPGMIELLDSYRGSE